MADTPDSSKDPDSPKDDALTPQSLAQQLAEYKLALEEEFELATSTTLSDEELETRTRKLFKDKAAMAAAQIVFLAEHASSESVKLSASRAILTEGFRIAAEDADPMAKLINDLTSTPTPEPTTDVPGTSKSKKSN